jgi:hypothetical protein
MGFVHCRGFGALLVALLSTAVPGQSIQRNSAGVTEAQGRDIATALVNAHNTWGEKLSSSGAVLRLEETARHNGRIFYRLHVVGLPAGHRYSLVQWPVTQREPSVALEGVTFDKSGVAVCAGKPGTCGDPAKPDDPIDLQTFPAKGEPLRFAIVAQDDPRLRAAVKIIPVPNAGIDKECRVDAVLLMPHAELIWLEASNFPANTGLRLTQDSEGEIHKSEKKTDGAGRYAWAIMPAKAGLTTGTVRIRVQAAGCSPEVSARWGYPGK